LICGEVHSSEPHTPHVLLLLLQVLQMVGRAGRPQFDTEGVAVIMTCRDNINRYKKLLAGQVSGSWLHGTMHCFKHTTTECCIM
jgi:hypothetical protein